MDNMQIFIEFVAAVKEYIANLKQQLFDALADDMADDETIAKAEADAIAAREELEAWKKQATQKNADLAAAIIDAKSEIIGTTV
jgi:hypothetical protein